MRSLTSRPNLRAGLILGLSARLPVPRGRQLGTARWCHAGTHPPAKLTTVRILALHRGLRKAAERGQSGGTRVLALAQLFLHTHQSAQLVASARQSRAHRANWYFKNRGYLLIGHAFETDE
jgi:hypothetical protein